MWRKTNYWKSEIIEAYKKKERKNVGTLYKKVQNQIIKTCKKNKKTGRQLENKKTRDAIFFFELEKEYYEPVESELALDRNFIKTWIFLKYDFKYDRDKTSILSWALRNNYIKLKNSCR